MGLTRSCTALGSKAALRRGGGHSSGRIQSRALAGAAPDDAARLWRAGTGLHFRRLRRHSPRGVTAPSPHARSAATDDRKPTIRSFLAGSPIGACGRGRDLLAYRALRGHSPTRVTDCLPPGPSPATAKDSGTLAVGLSARGAWGGMPTSSDGMSPKAAICNPIGARHRRAAGSGAAPARARD